MWSRGMDGSVGVLGLSVVLSGCLKIEAIKTVFEDGRGIDHLVVQPRISMGTLRASSARRVNSILLVSTRSESL